MMRYENWKHILGIFSFQNSVSNGIFVIKHTLRDLLSVLCQVRLSLSQSPPTTFSFTPKTQPTKTLLHSQIQAYLFTLHPLYPTTLTEPPPHPTHSGHSSDRRTRWRSSRLGFSFFFFFLFFFFFSYQVSGFGCIFFPLLFTGFLFFAWDRSPSLTASCFGKRIVGVTSRESCGDKDGWLDSPTGFKWNFQWLPCTELQGAWRVWVWVWLWLCERSEMGLDNFFFFFGGVS